MSKRLSLIGLLLLFVISAAVVDVQATNEVRILPTTLHLGQSMPVEIQVTNDRPAYAIDIGLLLQSVDGGAAHFDSAQVVGRMSDPSVLDYRVIRLQGPDTTAQDSIRCSAIRMFGLNLLPVGSDVLLKLYLTAESEGAIHLDSTWLPPVSKFAFLLAGDTAHQYVLTTPDFVSPDIPIIESTPPPAISVGGPVPIAIQGNTFSFDVSVTDPNNYPFTVTLTNIHDINQDQRTPQTYPIVSGTAPARVSWTPGAGDVGVWQTTIHACDSAGNCSERQLVIQVVSDESYVLAFDQVETGGFGIMNDFASGDFDNDGRPDLITAGNGWNNTPFVGIWAIALDGTASIAYDDNIQYYKRGLQPGFIDSDSLLDFLVGNVNPAKPAVVLYRGDGDFGFQPITVAPDKYVGYAASLGDFNGDAEPDYAYGQAKTVQVLLGSDSGTVVYTQVSSFSATDTVRSLRAADFNNDGYDDLAVGTTNSTMIYMNDGSGEFTLQATYPQSYGSSDIQVTGDGADINNDGKYDLCVAAPSIGGTYSSIVIYLGNGDGTFDTATVEVVRGQAKASRLVDMNGDGDLDIVYLNTSMRYVGILYGNSAGQFENETRYAVDKPSPMFLDCFDYDLDGDIDVVVPAFSYNTSSSLFVLANQLNPQNFRRVSFRLEARDNADLTITSETGARLSRITNSMPAAKYYQRDLGGNSSRDSYAMINGAQPGMYTIHAAPRQVAKANEPFGLSYTLNGTQFRLADQSLLPGDGVNFGIFPAGQSAVSPIPGVFIRNPKPSFDWTNQGTVRFQLAGDLAFSNLIVDANVSGSHFDLGQTLPGTDTTLYYWRLVGSGDPKDAVVYAFNLVSGTSGICGDFNADGFGPDLADLVAMVDYMFRGNFNDYNPLLGDANSDGLIDISDLIGMVNYLYAHGPRPGC